MSTSTAGMRLRSRNRSSRMAMPAAAAVAAALLIGLVFVYVNLLVTGGAGPKQSDFISYFASGRLIWTGHASDLYNFGALGRLETSLVRPLHVRNGVLPFVYPPFFAVLLAPLSALPLTAAFSIWVVLNIAFFAVSVWLLAGVARLRGRAAILFCLLAASFLPVFVAVTQGQTSLFLLALATGILVALAHRRSVPAGILLALMLIKPPYVVPILLVLVLGRRWKALASFAVAAALLLALPLVVGGFGLLGAYASTLRAASGWHAQFGYGPHWNHSLAGLVELLLPAGMTRPLELGLDVLVLAALAGAAHVERDLAVQMGLATLAAILISPHVLIHDLALVLLPVAVALRLRARAPRTISAALAAGYFCVIVGLRLVDSAPVQLSVLAMIALAGVIFRAALPQAQSTERAVAPPVAT